jgi:hypothetical protein
MDSSAKLSAYNEAEEIIEKKKWHKRSHYNKIQKVSNCMKMN